MSFLISLLFLSVAFADAPVEVGELKRRIFALAESYKGQADPDYSRQKSLDVLVKELLLAAPQPPVRERIDVLAGVWEQVWGPYDYRNDNRGIDPELGIEEIYQVISADGYYYNVSPLYKNGDRTQERIGLLRGEFRLDDQNADVLRVQFTDYPGMSRRPSDLNLWELPPLEEAGALPNRVVIVPSTIVRAFFGAGALREIYTDADMRLAYGSRGEGYDREALYVMKRK